MTPPKDLGMLLLAIWLILFGLTAWCLMLSPATRVQVKARVLKLLGKHPRPNSWSLP